MSGTGNPEQIREDIEAAREELGDTVEALAAKTDVTGAAKRKLSEAPAAAKQATLGARRKPVVLLVGATAVGFVVFRRRRQR